MGKVIDITDKLSFDGNPFLMIKGEKLEVNADTPTMIKIMALMSEADPGPKEMVEAMNLIFAEDARQKLKDMKLNFSDTTTVVHEAISLIAGQEENAPGER